MKIFLVVLLLTSSGLIAQEEPHPASVSVNFERVHIDTETESMDRSSTRLSYTNSESLEDHKLELATTKRKLWIAIVTSIFGFGSTIVTFLSTYFGAKCE